jgi:hypothetical protein
MTIAHNMTVLYSKIWNLRGWGSLLVQGEKYQEDKTGTSDNSNNNSKSNNKTISNNNSNTDTLGSRYSE